MPTISASEGTQGSSSTEEVNVYDLSATEESFSEEKAVDAVASVAEVGDISYSTMREASEREKETVYDLESSTRMGLDSSLLSEIIQEEEEPCDSWAAVKPSLSGSLTKGDRTGDALDEFAMASDRLIEQEVLPSIELSDNATVSPFDEKEEEEDQWLDVIGNGEIMKKVVIPGLKQTRPDRGQVVNVNLKTFLENNLQVENQEEFSFTLGDAEVVQGLELAIPLMDTKETAQIVINPRFAYGSIGKEPHIPPNSTLMFTVELLDVADEVPIETLTISERMKIGGQKKERGNFWFARGDFSQSVVCYRRALEYLDDENHIFSDSAESLQLMLEDRLKVYNNLALAQLKLDAYDAAIKSVDHVLRVQPQNVKALFRKGKILAAQGNIDEAISCMKKALKLDPDTKVIQTELARLSSRKTHENLSERELYRKMLGEQRQNASKQKGGSKFVVWGSFFGGLAAVVIGMFAYRQYHAGNDFDFILNSPTVEMLKEKFNKIIEAISEKFNEPPERIIPRTITSDPGSV